MAPFQRFEEKLGPSARYESVPPEVIARFSDLLPPVLIRQWEEEGWCSYDDEFLWIINPMQLEDVLTDWFTSGDSCLAIGRTAFADLFLWTSEGLQVLHTQYGRTAFMTDEIELFFNFSLNRESYVNDALNRDLYHKARKKLGKLAFDECYAFEPVLALGGQETVESLRKVKMREYLGILAQVAGTEA